MTNAGKPGQVARVIYVDSESEILWAKLASGLTLWISLDMGPNVEVGSVIIVFSEYEFDIAPPQVLNNETWLGVIRLKNSDRTLIEGPGGFVWLPTNISVEYNEWDTVESDDSSILKRVAEDPIRVLDHRPAAATIHNRFHVPKGSVTETFADVAGLDSQIEQLRELIATFVDPESVSSKKIRPVRGILFAGDSGTGKTLLARALANEAEAEFFQVRGPEVTSKWVNESEETLRLLFDHAASYPRSIIFLDEIDSIASARSSSSHEMSNRFVTQLLTLMDGFIGVGNVLVLGATNRVDHLDPTLLRRGRFDWQIKFSLPDLSARESILQVSFPSDVASAGTFPLAELAKRTEGWSGADLVGIWAEADMFVRSESRTVIRPEDSIVAYERARFRSGRGEGH